MQHKKIEKFDQRKQLMKKDSRYRFRYVESKKDSDSSSDLESDEEICVFLMTNVQYHKVPLEKRKKVENPFAEYYTVLNTCRREERKIKAKIKEEEEKAKARAF